MASSLTASLVLDIVRGRHPLFARTEVAEGSILQAIDLRQRSLLLLYGGAIEGLVSTTVDLAISFSGVLIGNDNGVPVYGTTFQDGWAQHSDGGVPYVDFSEPRIAGDPFGESGGTPGFPLPDDFLKLIHVSLTMADNSFQPVDIVPEVARLERHRSPTACAFLSGNRIVPIRALSTGNSGDMWAAQITSLQLSYVVLPRLASLEDSILLPGAFTEALVAGVAEFLALNAPKMTPNDKASMSRLARMAEESLTVNGVEVIGSALTPKHVIYRR